MKNNIGEAILIGVTLYAHFVWNLHVVISVLLILFAIFSWGFYSTRKKTEDLVNKKLQAEIDLLAAKAKYYARKKE